MPGITERFHSKMPRHVAMLLLAALALAGCVTSRSIVATDIDSGRNPSQGVAVRIEKIEDARTFAIDPPSPDIPSLMNGEIHNKEITSRAVARKRNGFGKAMGDVLLPEGESVSRLMQTAVTRAFRESGYRVLTPGESGYEQAAPVTARIDHFWGWFTPGFASVSLEFRANVYLKGTIAPIQTGRTFSTQVRESMQLVTESDWQNIAIKGVGSLITVIKNGLAEPSRASLRTSSLTQ